MSEQCEIFKDINECHAQKRRDNKHKSLEILNKHGIEYITKNNGVHCIIKNEIDYWPSTGLFKNRKTGKSGRGVFNLLKQLT